MPCPGLDGIEYVDAAVRAYYGTYERALADFVRDRNNCWCPKWVRRNYELQNKEASSSVLPTDVTLSSDLPKLPPDTTSTPPEKFPHGSDPLFQKTKFVFEPAGEPPVGEDPQRPEAYETDHHWKNENRERWQLHSERGPNIEPETHALPAPKPFEHLVNPD